MNQEFLNALEAFKQEMLTKFVLRAERQGERSVTLVGSKYLSGAHDNLMSHLMEEVDELLSAYDNNNEQEECIDVANMCFLLWWYHHKAQSQ